jgi:hypothetical protein|tara:strand:+ start:1238 stop:1852 length:615 start_codon:yes stop_codon:yes gene_type:complete
MALTKFDICSQALTKVGADTITSFSDGTHESNVCSVMYDTIKKSLLYYTFWNFAIDKQQLNKLSETPTDKKFTSAHSLPGDVIRIKAVIDQNGLPNYTYRKEGQKIFSSLDTVILEYVQNMDETNMPSFFVEALVAKIATEINEAITGNGALTNRLANDFQQKLRASRIADGQENPPQNIVPAGRLIEAHLMGSESDRFRHEQN